MSRGEYTVTIGADASQALAEFAKLGQAAQRSGGEIGKGLSTGLDTTNANIRALQGQIKALIQTRAQLKVDSSEFKAAQAQVDQLQLKLQQALGQRLRLQVDASALTAAAAEASKALGEGLSGGAREGAQATLRELNSLKSNIIREFKDLKAQGVSPADDAYKSLQARVAEVNQQIRALKMTPADLPQAVDGFRLLDGVVQGVAFSLSNAVVNGAQAAFQALGSVVTQFAALDTELRKAAAASGEAGAYGQLAATVDAVGIEAAGTTLEVAQLATELIRGGMTVAQANASLGAIVRGAEATGTAFATMGSNVSAALKGFGLPATAATRVVDALVTGANASATSVEGMGMAFKYAAPVARILGLSIEDLGVAVGLLTNAGIDASEAGVTLRNGLSKLASAAPQTGGGMQKLSGQAADAARAMKSLGVNIYNADGTLKPMRETLLQLKGAFDKLGPAAKIRLAASLFGGEDDGTKWLALLNQSNAEIIKMADTMSKTRGATNTARDAMQGLELKAKALDGTLGSIGNTFGMVAATALIPLVDFANNLAGAIVKLPDPVKALGAGFVLLTGGILAATAAAVIYQRVMASAVGQTAIAEIVALGGAFRTTLVAGIRAAITNFGALAATLATIALRLAVITLAINTWNAITGASDRVGQGFNQRLKETQKALDSITPAADRAAQNLKKMQEIDGAEKFRRDINSIFDIVGNFSRAADFREITKQTALLQGAFGGVQDAALKTLQSLKNATTLTGEQRSGIAAQVSALKVVKDQAKAQAEAYRDLAAAQRSNNREEDAAITEANARAMESEVKATDRLIAGLESLQARTEAKNAGTERAIDLTERLTAATRDRIATENSVAALDNRIAVGQQLLSLAQALGQAEQSRFGVTRSALEFELQQAEKRGASEVEIGAIKDRIAANDRAAMEARYRALLQEQTLQQQLLAIEQEKSRIEAEGAVANARASRLEAELALSRATTEEEKQKIRLQIEGIDAAIAREERKQQLLAQTQPLERLAADLQAQAARNGLQAEAAAKGYAFALDGTLQPANALVELQGRISTVTRATAEEQARYTQLAAESGLAIAQAADGTLVLGRTQAEVNAAVAEMNRQIGGAAAGYAAAGQSAGTARGETDLLQQSLSAAGQKGDALAQGLLNASGSAGDAKGKVDGIGTNLGNAATPANALAAAFTKTGEKAPAIVQGSRNFAGWLSSASGFANSIAKLDLGRQMQVVASETARAATAARNFYNYLNQASALPGSRWTGGPVEAGQSYRINELGQEAFLSAGRLSLINAPANSIWRAPAPGVVIPAGVTARLRDRGHLAATPGGSSAGTAELAIEVGKLRREVGNLARKDWNVHVQHRTGPTGSQVMRTLLR